MADRPLSLVRLKTLPLGSTVIDRYGHQWHLEILPTRKGPRRHEPIWVHHYGHNAQFVASPNLLHHDHRPLQLDRGADDGQS